MQRTLRARPSTPRPSSGPTTGRRNDLGPVYWRLWKRPAFSRLRRSWRSFRPPQTTGSPLGSLPLNTVTHLAITSDGADTQLYRNAVAASSPIAITPQAPVALRAGFGN